MKLLYIFSSYSIKCPYLQQWATVLATRKEIEIAILFIHQGEKINPYHKDEILFLPFNFKNGKNLILNYLSNNLELKRIVKEVKRFKPSILHLHGCYNTYLSRLPLQLHFQHKFIFNLWGSDYNKSFFNSRKHNHLINALFKKADVILTLWYSLEYKIKKNSPNYAYKIKTIPWGIENEALNSSKFIVKKKIQDRFNIKKKDYVLLSLKGIIPNSNQDTILKAIALLSPKIPIKLIIHSPSRDEIYYKKLVKIVKQNKLESKVIFSSNYLTLEEFKGLSSIGNLSIIISSQDQFTRSLLEGIIEKTDLIVSDISPFQLLNNKFDLNIDMVNPDDATDLAQKIEEIYSQKNNLQIKQKRIEILKENFIFETQFKKILNVYSETPYSK